VHATVFPDAVSGEVVRAGRAIRHYKRPEQNIGATRDVEAATPAENMKKDFADLMAAQLPASTEVKTKLPDDL
jgi:hypothetical protein